MGLDIYVGSYTRYFTGNWENIVQQRGREEGWDVQIIRPDDDDDDDAITDPEDVRSAVLDWRREIETGLGNDLKEPLDWDESDDAPYFTDKPAWDGYGSLLLWAAYSEHPELKRPVASTEDWYSDPAFQKSVEPDFRTSFPSLLRDVEAWLPAQFMFNFKAADLSGKEMHFGSAYSLRDELYHLNKTTWDATEETLTIWRREGAEHPAPLETLARCAFGMFWQLVNDAIEHRLIMKLDY